MFAAALVHNPIDADWWQAAAARSAHLRLALFAFAHFRKSRARGLPSLRPCFSRALGTARSLGRTANAAPPRRREKGAPRSGHLPLLDQAARPHLRPERGGGGRLPLRRLPGGRAAGARARLHAAQRRPPHRARPARRRREWSRAELWNAAEKAEKRKDARTAREWEVALPDELGQAERRELAVRFAGGLAEKYGCAVDVALHAPDREGDQRNWHAHLLATTRKVTAGTLAEKCEIELSDAKRLSLGLAPARIEVESVRQMWAEEVNRQLSEAPAGAGGSPVPGRPARGGDPQGPAEKAAELDREPQVKLGWKVVQMERRGVSSDRGNQLRQVRADNAQQARPGRRYRPAPGPAHSAPRGRGGPPPGSRAEEVLEEQKRVLEEVEAVFRGQGTAPSGNHAQKMAVSGHPGSSGGHERAGPVGAGPEGSRRQCLARNAQDDRMGGRPGRPERRGDRGVAAEAPVQALAVRTGLKKPSADLRAWSRPTPNPSVFSRATSTGSRSSSGPG